MCPKDHDFNWVRARRECVVAVEFKFLKDSVKKSVDEFGEPRAFEVREPSPRELYVCRYNIAQQEYGVMFALTEEAGGNRHIEVINNTREGSFKVTLVLNEKGRCRYQVDGEGEYLRWQIVRRALEPLFFPSRRGG